MPEEILIFTNDTYRKSLLCTICLLFLINLYTLISGNLLSIIPMILQGSILIVHFKKWPEQRMLIKFWAGLTFLAGCAGLVSSCATSLRIILGNDNVSNDLLNFVYSIACITVAIYFYIQLPKSTKIVAQDNNTTQAA